MFSFFVNVLLPIITACIYFLMARYIKHIAPLRLLITGEKTYQYGFWVFLLFGIFLIGRPLQILIGPHPFPFIVSSIREFVMIGLLTPVILIGCINHLFYDTPISPKIPISIFSVSITLGLAFVIINAVVINGSHPVAVYDVWGMQWTANDGSWFLPDNPYKNLLPLLFLIRLVDPVIMMIGASAVSLWRARTFPTDSVYTNLPRKYVLQGIALVLFACSLLFTGYMAMKWNMQSQWYYMGALLAGVIEFIGLRIPPRRTAIKNDLN